MEVRRPQRGLAVVLLLAVVAVWGGTFSLVKDALQDASPLVFNLMRMLIAGSALVLLNNRSLRQLSRRTWTAGATAGVFLGAGYQLQTAGLARTSAANSAFITGLVVVFVPLLSLSQRLRSPRIPPPRPASAAGALLAFAGFALMTTTGGEGVVGLLRSLRLGDVLTLGCAVAFAAHLLSLSHFADVPAAQLATLQVIACTAVMGVTLPLGGPPHLHLSTRLVIALVITGLLATAFAFSVQSWAQQHLSPGATALLLTLEPVFALLTAFAFLHERPSRRSLAGAGLILGGILLTETLDGRMGLPPEPI